jgi:hypothetical protein
MKKIAKIFAIGFGVLAVASMVFSACKKEEEPTPIPEPPAKDSTFDPYNDSTGIEISDSIMVIFGSKKWKTLKYTSYIDSEYTSTQAFTEWVNIVARYPQAPFPYFRLKILKEPGNHTTYMAINNPQGVGHTIPGRLMGDQKGGSLLYYENTELYQPDGTRTSDWWPLDLTTSVLEFDEYSNTLTARVTGHMFHYKQWLDHSVNHDPINVADADTASIIISFGKLNIIHR